MKCDAPDCRYEVKNVSPREIESYLYINCPKCGAPLLTEPDWNASVLLNRVLGNPVIRFMNWVGRKLNLKMNTYRVEFKGNGAIDLKEVNTK